MRVRLHDDDDDDDDDDDADDADGGEGGVENLGERVVVVIAAQGE